MKVLEIGAETKPQAQYVWKDAEIVYLDINEVKDIPEMEGKRFILGDAIDLAKVLDGETFDGIFASHVLEHFPWWDIPRLLANWVTCLNPGGSIHIVVPSLEWAAKQILSETPSPALQGHLYSDMSTPYHIHVGGFTMRLLRTQLEKAGLAVGTATTAEYQIQAYGEIHVAEQHYVAGYKIDVEIDPRKE
jgi:predicted SAM-dependent methyltransferase